MTYAERELLPLGFRRVETATPDTRSAARVILSIGCLKLLFECACPAFPNIIAMGCPLHHEGLGGSHEIEQAKKLPHLFQ
ncbi:MAG: hypothetical protein KGI50_04455 [Patescibacteria group bacterium]|nr:hypothetical protein [Patescibacteria group bacterium]MDE2438461.1 hypothetical protein [Patescibacteria group bacterium]